jgi:hypothetical protein
MRFVMRMFLWTDHPGWAMQGGMALFLVVSLVSDLACGQETPHPVVGLRPPQESSDVRLEVDAGHVVKDLSRLRPGILLSLKTTPYALTKYARELAQPGTLVRIPLDFGWSSDPSVIDPLIEKVRRWGGEPLLFIFGVPETLSAKRREIFYEGKPVRRFDASPGNLVAWERMVRGAVAHFNAEKGYRIRYLEIGNEPDAPNFWTGTQSEYLQLYKASVKAARSADPSIKVGGPAVANWRGEIGAEGPLIKNLLEFARSEGLPVDFISWHAFKNDPYSLISVVSRIRTWKDASGFPQAKLFLDEWNHSGSVERDGPQGAAFVGGMLSGIFSSGLDGQVFAMLQDGDTSRSDFSGDDFGMLTVGGIAKASYNVFLAARLLGKLELRIHQSEGQHLISSTATKDRGFVAVLVSYSPPDALATATNLLFSEKGYTDADLRKWGWDNEKTAQLRRGEIEKVLAGLRASPQALRDLRDAFALYQRILHQADGAARQVRIVIKGLDVGSPVVCERYVIDEHHSNGLMAKDRIGARLQEVRVQARESGFGRAEKYLTKSGVASADAMRELLARLRKIGPDEAESALRNFRRNASGEERGGLEHVSARYAEGYEEGLRRGLDEINGWQEVRLARVDQKRYEPATEFRTTIQMEPHSVNLLLLRREGQRRQ